jgi:hypothetical protein
MIQEFKYLVVAVLACASMAVVQADGRVTVSIGNGRVSLEAHGATLREVLDAWARAGQTVVVNAEKIESNAPLDLSLTNVTEEQALAVLLRPLSGYTATRRAVAAANESRFDRIVLLPSSVASRDSAVTNTPPPAFAARPVPVQPPPQQTVMINGVARLIGPNGAVVEDDQQGAPPRPAAPRVFPGGDAPGPPPPPQSGTPSRPTTPAPGVVGSSTPGVVISPPPQRPGAPQPVQR